MKKILAIVLALAMVIVPMTFSVSAAAAAIITVGANTTVAAGDAISIPIAISGDVAGAQFDIALGDLENVTCTADAESYVYTAETNTIRFVDADLDGMSDLFTINATIPGNAVAGDAFTTVVTNLIVCNIDEELIDTAVVVGTYTVSDNLPIGTQTKGGSTRLIMKLSADAETIEAYDTVGFKIVIDGVEQIINVSCAYDSFYNNGKLVTAESLGCTYVAILEIGNINTATSVTAQGMINGTVAGTVRTIK